MEDARVARSIVRRSENLSELGGHLPGCWGSAGYSQSRARTTHLLPSVRQSVSMSLSFYSGHLTPSRIFTAITSRLILRK